MKKLYCILLLLTAGWANAQTALYNSGNFRIHGEGQIGFHTNLINDGPFDENLGLAGFYGEAALSVSGAFPPALFDTEVANDAGVDLSTPLTTANNLNFISGDFRTPRATPAIAFNFGADAFYVGDGDGSKINGYATVAGQSEFIFPVGDAAQLRPLILRSEGINTVARCAYFRENPDNPSTFQPFNTAIKPRDIGSISTVEFWRLEGSVPATITLTWNGNSNLGAIATDVGQVTIMGWSKSAESWLELGNEPVAGDLAMGMVSSTVFTPDDYEIITFGSRAEATDILTLSNYLLTPNGDGFNDVLIIPELELSPSNSVRIFDRTGLKVFEMVNYTDEFGGISNVNNRVINREKGLPEGVYFYLVTLDDLGYEYQGFLYLDR